MEKQDIKKALLQIVGSDSLRTDAPMREYTTFRAGGSADFLVMPDTLEQLQDLLALLRGESVPHLLMGNGSNLLFRDGGYRGVVIRTRGVDAIEVQKDQVMVEAGALLRKAADVALNHSLDGMAFASGIPGSIGGAVVMNAGAYGGEMKDIVDRVEVVTETGEVKTLAGEACDFGYRHSIIQEHDWVVTRVNLRLRDGDYNTIKAEMQDYNARRREKQPLDYPSAGSTFRRPQGYFAGKLVQDAGFKGYSVGGAQVSPKHSGFVINRGDATAKDIITLIETIQQGVKERFGVTLQTEVIIVGES